ncbi:MAG: sporulation protein YunB [Firmicutes bacterium]|nr:sporulation protein YunB [Bacillota bacterium]
MKKISRFKRSVRCFLFAAWVMAVLVWLCVLYDRFLLPSAQKVCESRTVAFINERMAEALENAIKENGINTSKLFLYEKNKEGRAVFLSTDTAAANRLCADTAQRLSRTLAKGENNVIYIKSGAFTGLSLLSESGPDIPVKISVIGDAKADCKTEVKGVGLNNVYYCIYIEINARAAAYNPLLNNEINITRRILLADAVYSGEVPSAVLPAAIR